MAQANTGAVPVAVASTTTYYQLFSDVAYDSMNGHVQTLLQPYGEIANSNPAQVESIALAHCSSCMPRCQGQPPVTYCFIVYHQKEPCLHSPNYLCCNSYPSYTAWQCQLHSSWRLDQGAIFTCCMAQSHVPLKQQHVSPNAAQLDNLIAAVL